MIIKICCLFTNLSSCNPQLGNQVFSLRVSSSLSSLSTVCANIKGVTNNQFTGSYKYFVLADDRKRKPRD